MTEITTEGHNINMVKIKTTQQVMAEEDCSKYIATVWAAKHNVGKFGNSYRWTGRDVSRFRARNKRVGAPQGKRRKK